MFEIELTPEFISNEIQAAPGIHTVVWEGGAPVIVDPELDDSSENPVQNKAIKAALDEKGTYSKPVSGIPASDLAEGVIPPPEIFWAVRGSTSHAQIVAAYNAGKAVFCKDNNIVYQLVYKGTNGCRFAAYSEGAIHTLDEVDNLWTEGIKTIPSNAYTKPLDGIPRSDLNSDVRSSLGKADTALQTAPVTSVNGQTGAVTVSAATDTQVQNAVDDYLDDHPTVGGVFSNAAKRALLALLEKVAYIDENGQEYLDTLEQELFTVAVVSITAVYTQSGTVYDTDELDSLRDDLVVTANYVDGTSETVMLYTLSGTLTAGTCTIAVSYGGKTTTFSVTVTGVVYLYNNGDECSALTGGWDLGSGLVSNGTRVTTSKGNNCLDMTQNATASNATAQSISTHNAVDLTNYTQMVIEYASYKTPSSSVANYWAYFPTTLTTASNQTDAYGSNYSSIRSQINAAEYSGEKKTRTIDISSYGLVYISLNLNSWSSAGAGTYMKAYTIYLK